MLDFVNSSLFFTHPVNENGIVHNFIITVSPQMITQQLVLVCTISIYSKIYQSQYCSNMKPALSKLSTKPCLSVMVILPTKTSHKPSVLIISPRLHFCHFYPYV